MATPESLEEAGATTSAAELRLFDKYHYYTASVQDAQKHVRFLEKVYREARGRDKKPQTLREDFCGAFAICCEWVKLGPEREAIGVDVDPEPLAYGQANHLPKLKPMQQLRVRTVAADVRERELPQADIIAGLNFSYYVFKARADLLAYFRNCQRTLEAGGVLVLDCLGGPAYQVSNETNKEYAGEGFRYFWEQETFEPLTNEARFHIHFERSGEPIRLKVFSYDWRIWGVPELKEALLDAGFSEVQTLWETTGRDGEGTGKYRAMDRADEEPDVWLCYLAALR